MKAIRRMISALLVLAMVTGMVPGQVFAEETTATEAVVETTAATEATTEPVAETTAATEAVTEPVVETTAATEGVMEPTEETVPEKQIQDEVSSPAVMAAATSGTCGDNVNWSFSGGVLTVSGTGNMDDYAWTSGSPWEDLYKEITSVKILDGVTSIGNYAFEDCCYITDVSISTSVTRIGKNAFDSCWRITEIPIPDSLAQLDEYAFANCSGLTRISIPGSVETIGDYAFSRCWRMTEATISQGVKSIGKSAFYGCYALLAISIPSSVITIDTQAFAGCSVLESLTLAEGITEIGDSAFQGTAIESVTLPSTVVTIGAGAFRTTKLTGITIPDNVTTLGRYAFADNDELSYVKLGSRISEIGERAFLNCTKLIELEIPDSVTYIDNNAFASTGLKKITIPESITKLNSYLFSGCVDLKEVKLPNTLVEIGAWAFGNCYSLEEIEIPDGVELICGSAFEDCINLTEVIIPNSVTQMGSNVFDSCTSLQRVRLSNKLTEIPHAIFWYCSGLTSVTVPSRIKTVGSQAFQPCTSLSSIILPGVTSINSMAFRNCSGLTSIYLSKDLEIIGNEAFYGCSSLTDVYFEGSAEQWEEVTIGHSNSCLTNATVHFNYPIPKEDYYDFKITPKAAGFTFQSRSELKLTFSLFCNDEVVEDWPNPSIHIDGTDILTDPSWTKAGNDWQLTLQGSMPGTDTLTVTDFRSGEKKKLTINVNPNPITEIPVNENIKINGSGRAYAFYQGDPYVPYIIKKNGQGGTHHADMDGLVIILLDSYDTPGTYSYTLEFIKAGQKELEAVKTFEAKVTVTPLEFNQNWTVSMDAEAGASFGPGVKIEGKLPLLGGFKGEAALGKLEAGAGIGHAMNVARSYSGGTETLEFTSDWSLAGKVGIKSGIDGEFLKAEADLASASAGMEATGTAIYGIRLENYSKENIGQQKAIATYLFGEILRLSPNNLMMEGFQQMLAAKIYDAASVDVIRGVGAVAAGHVEAGVGAVKVNDVNVLSAVSTDCEASISITEKEYSNGDETYSASSVTDASLEALSVVGVGGVVAAEYLGKDVSLEIQKKGNKETLETSSLSASAGDFNSIIVGEQYTANYNRFRFEGDALTALSKNTKNIKYFLDGSRFALNNTDLEDMGNYISLCENPIEYNNVIKSQKLLSASVGFGVQLGVGVDIGATLSYLESTDHTTEAGYAYQDNIYKNGRSNNLSAEIASQSFNLLDIFKNAAASLAKEAAEYFAKKVGTIKNGVTTLWSWITGNPGSKVSGTVSLCTPSGEEPWLNSHTLEISGTNGKQSATMGRPVVISITDDKTGEDITDLSKEPLTFTMRFTAEELAGCGGQGKIPVMYRCSDDGKYLEFIGGEYDAENMTVTAEITKPGQYVLAVPVYDDTDSGNTPVSRIELDKTRLELAASETYPLTATVFPGSAANQALIWKSANEAVAIVDEAGVVTALSKGSTVITATAADGYGAKATCMVDVSNTVSIVTDPTQMESPHDYPADSKDIWQYSANGAVSLEVTFDSRTILEENSDYIHIYDSNGDLIGSYTGTQLAGKTVTVPGSTVKIQLVSDGQGTAWGFKVTEIKANYLQGDFTRDTRITEDDAIYLIWHTLFPQMYPISGDGDLNGDGKVDQSDAVHLLWNSLFPEVYPL